MMSSAPAVEATDCRVNISGADTENASGTASMLIDHIGIVVRSLEEGIAQWENLFGYSRSSDIVRNVRQKVLVVFLTKPGSLTVKLLQPSDSGSPVFRLASQGGGLHHICFRCDDLGGQLTTLRIQGAKVVVPPEPGEAFNNQPIAFVLAGNGLNVELIDTEEKAGLSALSQDRVASGIRLSGTAKPPARPRSAEAEG